MPVYVRKSKKKGKGEGQIAQGPCRALCWLKVAVLAEVTLGPLHIPTPLPGVFFPAFSA